MAKLNPDWLRGEPTPKKGAKRAAAAPEAEAAEPVAVPVEAEPAEAPEAESE